MDKHFNNHVVPPRGATKSVWGQTKEITKEPYTEGFETIGMRMRERQKSKERGGPFLTGLDRSARVQTSFDTSRAEDITREATYASGLPTPSSRMYKNSMDESINKMYFA